MASSPAYLPGSPPAIPGPLARYLPPVPSGVAAAWLQERFQAGSWVLDPFGTSPRLATEIARAGYRLLVAANNPISRCILEMAAAAPAADELRASLAELAAAHRGDERIEPHIRSLYQTACAACGQPVMADYFVWERGATAPFLRSYHCPQCGDEGERPTDAEDARRAEQYSASGLHRARALERVTAPDDPDRAHAEEALAAYLPRSVYALFTLINKLDALPLSPQRRRYLRALMLTACDAGSVLWGHPAQRERPRQLGIPPRFRENNLWLALENGISLWTTQDHPIPLTIWPEQPPIQGGICLFEGPLRDLAHTPLPVELACGLGALPRPNQAFWTLSALWAGWLWGREAATAFKSVLRRRRYDWAWHTAALSSAFTSLMTLLPAGVPFWGVVGEAEPGFLTAALLAAENSGLESEGLALRVDSSMAQISWRKPSESPTSSSKATHADQTPTHIAERATASFLRQRGQPSAYMPACTAAVAALASAHAFPRPADAQPGSEAAEPRPAEQFNRTHTLLRDAFSYRSGFLRYGGSDGAPEVGSWWFREEVFGAAEPSPLADRVEIALVRYLQKHPDCSQAEVDQAVCAEFTGLQTPDTELVQACLESYGEYDPAKNHGWRLRQVDQPAVRRADLENYRSLVRQLGERLGYRVEGSQENTSDPLLWYEPSQPGNRDNRPPRYAFYILASAAFGELLYCTPPPAHRAVIVLPGGRANLVAYKLHTDPRLSQKLESDWAIIKYRHLRWLLDNLLVNAENLDEQLRQDPLTYSPPQIRLL